MILDIVQLVDEVFLQSNCRFSHRFAKLDRAAPKKEKMGHTSLFGIRYRPSSLQSCIRILQHNSRSESRSLPVDLPPYLQKYFVEVQNWNFFTDPNLFSKNPTVDTIEPSDMGQRLRSCVVALSDASSANMPFMWICFWAQALWRWHHFGGPVLCTNQMFINQGAFLMPKQSIFWIDREPKVQVKGSDDANAEWRLRNESHLGMKGQITGYQVHRTHSARIGWVSTNWPAEIVIGQLLKFME